MDQTSWKILVVDDDEDDYVLIRLMLSEARRGKYILEWARTYEEGWKMLQEGNYDVVLMDYNLGPHNGLELTRKAIDSGCPFPIILFTGQGSYEIDMEAMEAGVTLYLTKSETSPLMLERSIRYAIEHKHIQEKLIESEAKYRELIRYAPAGIYEVDFRKKRFVSVNDEMCELSGYSREELLSMSPFDILDEEGIILFRERINRWMAGEEPEKSVEYKVRAKDGHTIHAILNTSFTKDAEGKPLGATVIGFDITERRRVEEIAKHQHELLETVFQNTSAAINLMRGNDLRIEVVNPAYQVFASCEAMVGKTLDELCPEMGPKFLDLCRQVLATGEPFHVIDDFRMVRRFPGGQLEPAYFSWSLFRVDLPGEKGWGILNTAWETTERKRAEEALLRSQKHISRLVDTSYEGIWSVDRNGETTFVNQRAAEILGYTIEEIRMRENAFAFLMSGEELAGRQTLAKIVAGESGRVEAHACRKDGSEAVLLVSYSPILDECGEFQGALAMFTDITERKQMEKSLQSYTEQLERSNQELENFAFMASHDLREPLRKIEAFSKQLVQTASSHLDKTERDYLERMRTAASRMSKLVDDLLTLSRVTSRGLSFELVDLNQIARSVLDDLDVPIRQTGGTVELGDLPLIRADELQIHQLLQNLIGNALKFHRPGVPPEVKVSARSLAENQVEISVEDHGIGFDMSQASRLFQPFQRLRGKSEFEGTGIGLSICRKIAERHGGSITARSQPGDGTVFIVTLPIEQPVNVLTGSHSV